MDPRLERGQFVHIVATVDLGQDSGAIRYVNPATTGMTASDQGHPDVEMSVEDTNGQRKKTWHPVVRFASPGPDGKKAVGLIQEDIPYEPWMKVVLLLVRGKEVGRYQAGIPDAAPSPTLDRPAAAVPPGPGLTLGTAGPAAPPRRRLLVHRDAPKRAGLTYTVQVRPEGAGAWNTIAVGRETPDVEIDRNQFPGARHVDVRIVQTTGFEQRILAEEKVDLAP
jgi:hypothetical protein